MAYMGGHNYNNHHRMVISLQPACQTLVTTNAVQLLGHRKECLSLPAVVQVVPRSVEKGGRTVVLLGVFSCMVLSRRLCQYC